ncbi:hypothetical protein MKW94_016996 [Papaver nudicaule]|uniref:Uncharacterized protein n=1 Tax=Papaver nudicaule TaxID=74823 RepID=A0AA41UY64_PAPNU|nr:hypothetical protein [Papaver nudicaule]
MDQKKRTLDALERRFALAKAEVLQQQQPSPPPPPKNRKLSHVQEGNEEGIKNKNSSSTSLGTKSNKADASSSTPVSHKGHFAFTGYTPVRGTPGASDSEGDGPTYSQICQPVHDNLLKTDVEPTSRGSTVDKILHKLLQSGDSAQKYMQGSRSMKIDNWMLLDNLVQGHGATVGARIKDFQSHSKRSRKHMSTKQHKKCGSFDLPKECHNFDYFKPMHEMWKDYITQVLKNVGTNQLSQCIMAADLHGAILQVSSCKINSYTGVSGIMIRETAETFGIITQDNKLRVVPKKPSVFILRADGWRITLHGDKFTSRNLIT